MSAGQVLLVVAAAAVVLLGSETLLRTLRLHRTRIGAGRWLLGIGAAALAAHWADGHLGVPGPLVHAAAVGVGALLTCLWLNDPRPLPPRPERRG